MYDLKYWQEKIKEKRKQTEFRDFIRDVSSWFNLLFYRNQGNISRYPETPRVKNLLEVDKYNTEYGDGVAGIDYDFSKSFIENYSKVFINVPKMSSIKYGENPNCDFADTVFGAKNSYLTICVGNDAENILYSVMVYSNVKNVLNSVLITGNSENIYQVFQSMNCFNIFYSKYITNSNNIWFSTNLVGCSECIFCDDLDNQSYCIKNKKYEKEEYFLKKKEILKEKEKFFDYFKELKTKPLNKVNSNCSGDGIKFCENVENGYMVNRVKDARNVAFSDGISNTSNLYDCFDVGEVNDIYAWMGCGQWCSNMYIGSNAGASTNIFYSFFLNTCSYCIGCVGLKNKSYCILNKQYTKEEWEVMADKIFSQMEADGTLGDSFPGTLNPFYFNDTFAYLIDDSFTKEEVTKLGYLWREENLKVDIPEGSELISVEDLDKYEGFDKDGKWKIDKSILNKVIIDNEGNYYRIIELEYDFLLKYELPIPRLHWLDRIKLCLKSK